MEPITHGEPVERNASMHFTNRFISMAIALSLAVWLAPASAARADDAPISLLSMVEEVKAPEYRLKPVSRKRLETKPVFSKTNTRTTTSLELVLPVLDDGNIRFTLTLAPGIGKPVTTWYRNLRLGYGMAF